jgi:hypothetical protein
MTSQNLRVATWVPPGVQPTIGQMIGVSALSPLDTEFTTPAFPEAPQDAKLYGRKDAAWALVPPLPFAADAPANTNTYGRLNGAWAIINKATVGLQSADNTSDLNKPLSIATQAALDTKTEEAPNDGKQYARQSKAWSQVVNPVFLTVDDNVPAAFKIGDRWIRPETGQEAVRVPTIDGAGAWLAPAGAADETLTPILLNNGTVAAPALAWAAQPDFGWSRSGPSSRYFNSNGVTVEALDSSGAAGTSLNIFPRTPGSSSLVAYAGPPLAAVNQLASLSMSSVAANLTVTSTGAAPARLPFNITSSKVSTLDRVEIHADATADATLILDKKAGTTTNSIYGHRAGVQRWVMQLGDGNAETGGNAGSHFAVYRYNDAGVINNSPVMMLNRTDGSVNLAGVLNVTGQLNATGQINAAGNIVGQSFIGTPGQAIGWSGTVNTGGAIYQMLSYGDPGYGAAMYVRNIHVPGSWAGVEIQAASASYSHRIDGNAYASGSWVSSSDARLKTNETPLVDVLAKLSMLRAYEYDREDLTNYDGTHPRHIGLIAQDVEAVFPLAVHRTPATEDEPEPLRYLNYNAVAAVLVDAINLLSARMAALEAA